MDNSLAIFPLFSLIQPYKKVGLKMKLLKITLTIIMSALLAVANAEEKQMARVLYKSVDSNNQTLMSGIKVEVRNKDSGKVVESFVAHSKMLLLPLSSRFEIVGLFQSTPDLINRENDISSEFMSS